MATSAIYELFPMLGRETTEKGTGFRTGRRTGWTVELRVAKLDAGGSVTVTIETSPDGSDEDSWSEHASFGAKSSTGLTTLDDESTPSVNLADHEQWIRGRVTAITGEAHIELLAYEPWLDPTDSAGDMQLVSKKLRNYSDGLTRLVEDAERDILGILARDGGRGALDADVNNPGFFKEMQAAIAEQADHLRKREELERSKEPSALVTLRDMPQISRAAASRLRRFRPSSKYIWPGR